MVQEKKLKLMLNAIGPYIQVLECRNLLASAKWGKRLHEIGFVFGKSASKNLVHDSDNVKQYREDIDTELQEVQTRYRKGQPLENVRVKGSYLFE